MANLEEVLKFQEKITQVQATAITQSVGNVGETIKEIKNQIGGLATAIYTQSVTQNVPCLDGNPKEFKDWIKSIEKYVKLTNLANTEIPKIAYQSCSGPVGDFIGRYLREKEKQNVNPEWANLRELLTKRFADITDAHQAFVVLRNIKQ